MTTLVLISLWVSLSIVGAFAMSAWFRGLNRKLFDDDRGSVAVITALSMGPIALCLLILLKA